MVRLRADRLLGFRPPRGCRRSRSSPPPAGLPPEHHSLRPSRACHRNIILFDPRGLAPRVKQFRQSARRAKRKKADGLARGEVVPVFSRTRPSSFSLPALSPELWLRRDKPAGGQHIPTPAGLPPERLFFDPRGLATGTSFSSTPAGLHPERQFSDPRGLAPRVKQFRQSARRAKRKKQMDWREESRPAHFLAPATRSEYSPKVPM